MLYSHPEKSLKPGAFAPFFLAVVMSVVMYHIEIM